MAQLKQLLQKLNLSEKETAIFLAMVKLGKAAASAIARASGITRTHVYDIVENLRHKGLVSEVEERGVKTYEATDYAGIMAYVSRQQKELQTVEKKLVQAAGEFNALQLGAEPKTKVRFFDGVEGVRGIYEEIRKDFQKQEQKFELLTIFSPQNLEQIMPGFQYFAFANALARDIVAADDLLPEYQRQIAASGCDVTFKVWPKKSERFPTDNIAWQNKLVYIDLTGFPSGIIIENQAIFTAFTMWFNQLWTSLP